LRADHRLIGVTQAAWERSEIFIRIAQVHHHTPGRPQERPQEGTLLARILELIEASDRPKRPWQIQKELRLARMPSAELSWLLTMGCLIRPKEGIYAVPGRNYGGSSVAEGK
jgi:hypothetical protein